MKKIYVILLFLVLVCTLSAQQITNVQQKVENGRIVVTYDLTGSNEYEYTISVKAKSNYGNCIIPSVIAGDVGTVKPGRNKIIYWEPLLEGRSLEGWIITLDFKKTYNKKGYLGIHPKGISPVLMKIFDFPNMGGVLIDKVEDDTFAQRVGLKKGDVIIEFDGERVRNLDQFRSIVVSIKVGDKVSITFIRNGKEIKKIAILEVYP